VTIGFQGLSRPRNNVDDNVRRMYDYGCLL